MHLALVERRVVLLAGELDAVVIGIDRLDDRLAAAARRDRRGRRPASAAGTSARRRGSRPSRDRRRPRRRRPASRAGSRAPWRSSACRRARRSRRAGTRMSSAVSEPLRRIESRSSRATRAAGTGLLDFGLDPLGAEAGLLEIRRPQCGHVRRARAPSSCSSDSGPGVPRPRRARPARRCSSGQSTVPRALAAEHRGREARAGSAARAPARRARAAPSMRVAQRPAQDDVRALRPRTPRACPRRCTAASGRSSTRRSSTMRS